MSEPIAHMAVADDCRRLVLESESICEPFERVLSKHPQAVRLGSMTRSGGTYMVPLLEKYRNKELTGDSEKRLAFVLGWIAHRAADRFYKTIYRQLDPEAERTHNIRIYHDLVLYDKVYDNGARDPFIPGLLEKSMESQPGSGAMDVTNVEHLFGAKWLQDMLELHSFIDDDDDIDDWIDNVLSSRQYYRLDHQGAYESPDPDKMERFITNANFYDPDDPIIRLVRSIQQGSPDRSINVEKAVEEAITGSQYARSLNLGYAYLKAASEYFKGAIDKPMLKYRLHHTPMILFEGEFGGREETSVVTKMEYPSPGEPAPPGRITAIAATDDCYRLTQYSNEIVDPISESLERHPDAARIGGVLRSPDEQIPHLLQRIQEQWPGGTRVELADVANNGIDPEYISFVSGALCHAATETNLNEYSSEQRLRQDATILREFGDDIDIHIADSEEIADVLDCFWLRSIVGLHTFVPDRDDVEGWMDRLFNWSNEDEEFRRRYAEAYTALGEETNPEFYDQSDPIIRVTRAIQREEALPSELDEAITATSTSQYADAVREGFQSITVMSEFLQGEIDIDILTDKIAG